MITAGFSILKSLGKPKRKRDGDESDSPGDPDTDSASKRARARASGGNGAAATKSKGAAASPSFITSSVRKTKTKGKTSKSEVSGNGGDDRVERDLRARFQSVDEGEEAREKRVPRSKSEKSKTGPAGRAKKSAAGAGGVRRHDGHLLAGVRVLRRRGASYARAPRGCGCDGEGDENESAAEELIRALPRRREAPPARPARRLPGKPRRRNERTRRGTRRPLVARGHSRLPTTTTRETTTTRGLPTMTCPWLVWSLPAGRRVRRLARRLAAVTRR
jgi:hypothetical protein